METPMANKHFESDDLPFRCASGQAAAQVKRSLALRADERARVESNSGFSALALLNPHWIVPLRGDFVVPYSHHRCPSTPEKTPAFLGWAASIFS